jgi:O-antigen ligase
VTVRIRIHRGRWSPSVHEGAQELGHEGFRLRAPRRRWGPTRTARIAPSQHLTQSQENTALGNLAFVFLWLLVFAIPWEDAVTIPGFGTSARLIGMAALCLGVYAIVETGKVRRPMPGHILMAVFVLLAGVSYLWSLYPEGTLTQAFSYIQLLTMVWLIWELASRPLDQIRLMQAYVFGTLVSGVDTVYLYLSHQESVYQRYAGANLDANDLGLIMALSIPVSYYLFIRTKGRLAWVYGLQLVLAGVTILLTASRGATLATIVALLIVPLTQAHVTGRKRIAVFLTVSLVVCGAIAFVPVTSWDRLSTVPTEFAQGTFTGRTVIWAAGWEIFRLHPFLGIGSNAFRTVVSRVLAEPIRADQSAVSAAPPAHNTFLSVLVEQGVIGFTLFCALLAVLALSLRAMPSLTQRLWIVWLGVWVVGASSLTWEMRKPTWFFFGLLLAQCGCMARMRGTQSYFSSPCETQLPVPHTSRS